MSLRDLTCNELFEFWEAFIKSGNAMNIRVGDHRLFVSFNTYYDAYVVGHTYKNNHHESRLYFELLNILTFTSNLTEKGQQPHFELKWMI